MMSRYIFRRLVQAVPIFFGITILSYLLMSLSGNPLLALVLEPNMTQAQFARISARLGVNDPWPLQYTRWLLGDDWLRWDSNGDGISDHSFLIPLDADGDGIPDPPGMRRGILRGDFGTSFALHRPVLDLIFERIPATLELSITSLIIGSAIGILLGIMAAVQRGRASDNVIRVTAVLFNAVPDFWLSLLVLLFFGSYLRVLPIGDRCKLTMDASCPPIYMRLEYMVLPVFIYSTGLVAGFSRLTRTTMLDELGKDYVRTARSKGVRERTVWYHAWRNGLIPVATGLGPAIIGLVGGSVIVERIFNYPGVGKTLYDAAIGRDYPVVMASVIYGALTVIFGYLLSDILYVLIDPRIHFE